MRDNLTGTYTTVAALPGNEAFLDWTVPGGNNIPFGAADPSFDHILVSSNRVLAPGGVAEQPNLYEFSDGTLRLISTAAGPAVPSEAAESFPNVVSVDGSRIYFAKGGALYLQEAGRETPVLVSEDPAGNPAGASFVGAVPDGDVAFFRTAHAVYRFVATAPPGDHLTRLTPTEGVEGEGLTVVNAWAGEDGSTFYLAAVNQLTPDARPIERDPFSNQRVGFDLYAWHAEPGQEGSFRYLGQTKAPGAGEGNLGFRAVSVSPDGRYFGFESYGQLTPDAIDGTAEDCAELAGGTGTRVSGRCSNVFAYSYDSNRLACVTCSGAPPVGESRIGGKEGRGESVTAPPAMLDDGMIVFDTPNALVARDTNGVRDAYAWRDGTTQLISTGTDSAASEIIAASADGRNIFFVTAQALVGQDDDTFADLYDARIDGGLPQEAPVTSRACADESTCRPGAAPASPPAQPGSGTVGGGRGVARSCSAVRAKAGAATKRSRALVHRARQADGKRATTLRRRASQQTKTARRLGRMAHDCEGGGR